MDKPLLSVVVPSYNSEQFIGECLASLNSERCDEVEFILIDGGSTDRTMELVEDYAGLFEHIVSEQDDGQSDAFNKGFRLARGKYLTWLNSDDRFCPGAIKLVLDEIRDSKFEWYAANVLYIDRFSIVTRCCRSGSFENFLLKFGILNVFGPSTIFSRKVFERCGDFRKDFHYCMDTEYWWRMASAGYRYRRIPHYAWALRLHEAAKTASSVMEGRKSRPKPMVKENERNWSMYFSHVSPLRRKIGKALARSWRVFNLSYIRALRDTMKLRGKKINEIEW